MKDLNFRVIGAGPIGSLVAFSLSKLGHKVTISDTNTFNQIVNTERTYAITHSTRKFLQKIQLWEIIQGDLTPFSNLCLRDSLLDNQLLFSIEELSIKNSKYSSIGWILKHSVFMEKILNIISQDPNISLKLDTSMPLKDQANKEFDLIICADGYLSNSKEKLDIVNLHYHVKMNYSALIAC